MEIKTVSIIGLGALGVMYGHTCPDDCRRRRSGLSPMPGGLRDMSERASSATGSAAGFTMSRRRRKSGRRTCSSLP
jgi:hypothetical protein